MLDPLVQEIFHKRSPRLYLDTAVFISIGRELLPRDLVDKLMSAVERHGVIVLVSDAHVRDALKPLDRDAPGFLASVLERFWCCALVTKGPSNIEPWTMGNADIEFSPCSNIREYLCAPEATLFLQVQELIQVSAHQAARSYKAAKEASAPRRGRLSQINEAIVVGSRQVLAVGLVSSLEEAVDYCIASLNLVLTAGQRAELIALARPDAAAIASLAPAFALISELERLDLWRIIRATAADAPGGWLTKILAGERLRNISREPEMSDSIDLEHCAYIPYVDVATCDRQAFAAIAPRLAESRGPRAGRLFRNGDLGELVAHIETLPTAAKICEQAVAEESKLA